MTKVAVIFADGCEEVEGLSVVDVLRRLNVQCDMVGLTSKKLMATTTLKLLVTKLLTIVYLITI